MQKKKKIVFGLAQSHVFQENVILVLFWNFIGQVLNSSDKNTHNPHITFI